MRYQRKAIWWRAASVLVLLGAFVASVLLNDPEKHDLRLTQFTKKHTMKDRTI